MQGYHIISCINPEKLPKIREQIIKGFKEFPEYKPLATDYVLGGFAALGNPGSFHHPYIRKMRNLGFQTAINSIPQTHKYRHMLFDRVLYRKKGQKAVAESWHRDITPNKDPEDTIYQCWINMDCENQYLSAVPGSHTLETGSQTGFAKIEKSDHKIMKEKSKKIAIPPGHIIIFNQNLIHEILAKPAKKDMLRIYFGIRYTNTENPLFDNNEIIAKQGVPKLPSGQMPPIYSINHLTIFMKKSFGKYEGLEDYCNQTFKPEILMNFYSKKNETNHRICPRIMPSLSEMKLPLYEEYSTEERAQYHPH
tara:strand:- start:4098 stop:5021 length:924 start_codon:yes stop_codon:yes gene_type:complete